MDSTPPEWALDRAEAILFPDRRTIFLMRGGSVLQNLALYVAAHEEPPVDPLLIEAREIVANADVSRTLNQTMAIREGRGGERQVEIALAALKRGIELAEEQSS